MPEATAGPGLTITDVSPTESRWDLVRKRVLVTADVVNANAAAGTLADVTGLSFAVTAGVTYKYNAVIVYSSAAITTGCRFVVNAPAGAFSGDFSWPASATARSTFAVEAVNTPTANSAGSNLTGNIARLEGFYTCTTTGVFQVRFASEIASSAITVRPKSYLEYEVV